MLQPNTKTETKMKNIDKQKLKDNLKIKNKEIVETEREISKDVAKIEKKVAEHKITQEKADKEIEKEIKEKSSDIKIKNESKKIKKTEAIVSGNNLSISTKHAIAICNFIRGKNIDNAIAILEDVVNFKRAVPMRGEIPHRKGRGIMSGRYPINAADIFIKLLKSLKANALVNELEFEKCKLFCNPNMMSRPYKRFGKGKHKRTSVIIKLILKEDKLKDKIK